jgi:DNA-binding XRE family transcriptional regulator
VISTEDASDTEAGLGLATAGASPAELLRWVALLVAGQAATLYAQRQGEEVEDKARLQAADKLAPILAELMTSPQLVDQADRSVSPEQTVQTAQNLASLCAAALSLPNWSAQRLRNLFLPAPGQPDVPDAFASGEAKIPSNPLLRAGFNAIYCGGRHARKLVGWKANEIGAPYFESHGNKGGSIQCYPRPLWGPRDAPPTTESLWEFIEGLSPRTADVAFAVLAQLCEPTTGDRPKYPMLQPVLITANAILRYKGIQRWGLERHGMYEWVADEMKRLQSLHFDVLHYKEYDRATMRVESRDCKGDRLFDIVDVVTHQENFLGPAEVIETAWRVRAGQWAFWWLNSEGRVWVGKMARVLLEFDHREQRGPALLAKKMGQRMLILHAAISQSKRELTEPVERIIGNLLEDIGEMPILEERTKNWAGRLRDRFDEAMLMLQRVGIFSVVSWPHQYGPEDSDRSKGWVQKWLQAKVSMTMPETAPSHQKSLRAPSPAKRLPKGRAQAAPVAPDLTQVRKLRVQAGWSQARLARHLKIDQSWISRIERGHPPSPEVAVKLNAWLASVQDSGSTW